MNLQTLSGGPSLTTLGGAAALGVLPFALWGLLGLGGGLFVALLYPALAGYLGWSIHRVATGRCWKAVVLCAGLSAASFAAIFFASVPNLSQFYGAWTIAAGGLAVFAGAFLAASALISVGVAARHASAG